MCYSSRQGLRNPYGRDHFCAAGSVMDYWLLCAIALASLAGATVIGLKIAFPDW